MPHSVPLPGRREPTWFVDGVPIPRVKTVSTRSFGGQAMTAGDGGVAVHGGYGPTASAAGGEASDADVSIEIAATPLIVATTRQRVWRAGCRRCMLVFAGVTARGSAPPVGGIGGGSHRPLTPGEAYHWRPDHTATTDEAPWHWRSALARRCVPSANTRERGSADWLPPAAPGRLRMAHKGPCQGCRHGRQTPVRWRLVPCQATFASLAARFRPAR